MGKNEPFIHIFKTPLSYYMYDVNKNAILRISEDTHKYLLGNTCEETAPDQEKIIAKMKENGFLSSNRVLESVHYEDEILEYYLTNKLHMIILQVTQQCNLRCRYCIYSGSYLNRKHSNKIMDFDTAKKGIDFLINNSKDTKSIAVGFYGGEPLLQLELIKKCIDYAEEAADGREILFTITTNATLLNHDVAEYLEKHNVSLLVSLDGSKEVHDRNRKFAATGEGTFDTIIKNLDSLRDKYPDFFKKVLFSAVLDPQNDFSCASEFFTSYDIVKDSSVRSSLISSHYLKNNISAAGDFSIKYGYELFKLFLYKLNRLDRSLVSKIVLQYYGFLKQRLYTEREYTDSLPAKGQHSGPCVPGATRLFMDINGNLFPCERVSEDSEVMKIGHIDNGFNIEKARRLLNVGKISEEKCKECYAFRFCDLCAAPADDLTDLSLSKLTPHCDRVKRNLEWSLKEYCMLVELGHDFQDTINFFSYE